MARVDTTLERALRDGAEARRADVQRGLMAAVAESRSAADRLQAAVRSYAEFSDSRAREVATASTANAEWAQSFIVVVSVVTVLGGVGVGYLLALLGVSRPPAALGPRDEPRDL